MRRLFSPVPLWGADGSDEGEEGSEGEESGEESKEDSTRTLTSKELESMTARAASRGSRKAVKTLRDELGFESVDELKAFIASQRKAEEEALSDQEKATKAAEARTLEADAEKLAAGALRRSVQIERQIVRAGVTDEKKTERIATLVQAELDSDLTPEEWDEALATSVGSLQKDMPELFAGAKRPAGNGDGGATGESQLDPDDEAEREKVLIDEYAKRGLTIPATL